VSLGGRKRGAEESPVRERDGTSRRGFPRTVTRTAAGCRVHIPAGPVNDDDLLSRVLIDEKPNFAFGPVPPIAKNQGVIIVVFNPSLGATAVSNSVSGADAESILPPGTTSVSDTIQHATVSDTCVKAITAPDVSTERTTIPDFSLRIVPTLDLPARLATAINKNINTHRLERHLFRILREGSYL